MTQLKDLVQGVQVSGILPSQPVTVIDVKWHGSTAIELVYRGPDQAVGL